MALGCQTVAPLPAVDLSAPGWKVRQGQAIWKPGEDKPEIAGDIVLSMHPGGSAFIEFTKPLPIVSGRLAPDGWEIEFPPQNKRYAGRGNPPKRIVWLQLIRAVEGHKIPDRWTVSHPSGQYIALENLESGERLEAHFQP